MEQLYFFNLKCDLLLFYIKEAIMKQLSISATYFNLSKAVLAKGIINLANCLRPVKFALDDHWTIELNGQQKIVNDIPPLSAKVFYDNELAGYVSPQESVFTGVAEHNEAAFRKACKQYFNAHIVRGQIQMEMN